MIAIPALLRSDFIHIAGTAIHIAPECTIHITGIRMESTGLYLRPVWSLLEGQFDLLRANATHIKNVPGRKTNVKDSESLNSCKHGLLQPSFVPDTVLRDLRELSRDRTSLVAERSRLKTESKRSWKRPTSNWDRWPAMS